MLGDFAAPADPDPVVAQDVIDETGKRGGARRLASGTAMHSDGRHLGRQTGSALFPRPQWPLLSSTRQVSVNARRCATPCPIPALTISCQVRRDKAVHAICQAVSRVWASGGLGATASGFARPEGFQANYIGGLQFQFQPGSSGLWGSDGGPTRVAAIGQPCRTP